MKKVHRYGDIKPLFTSGKIRAFSDIFDEIPKTVIAEYLGIEKSRFNELIDLPGGLKVKHLIRLAGRFELTLQDILSLIVSKLPDEKIDERMKDRRYHKIRTLVETRTITLFEDIVERVTRSQLARDLGKKRDRIKKLTEHVEEFSVRDIDKIGKLCDLTPDQIFQLIEAQYTKQSRTIT
ncbi:MAG TPA: hypothetical protein VNU70_00560 [Puia sp.]|nr:hypothetical protein [Puia sp.]